MMKYRGVRVHFSIFFHLFPYFSPQALGPPSLALAAAPFWALATADASCCGIRELLKPLVTPEAGRGD